jgi:hypothetical protein
MRDHGYGNLTDANYYGQKFGGFKDPKLDNLKYIEEHDKDHFFEPVYSYDTGIADPRLPKWKDGKRDLRLMDVRGNIYPYSDLKVYREDPHDGKWKWNNLIPGRLKPHDNRFGIQLHVDKDDVPIGTQLYDAQGNVYEYVVEAWLDKKTGLYKYVEYDDDYLENA